MISNKKLINKDKKYYHYNCGYLDDKITFEINNTDDNKIDISFVNSIKRIIEESNEAYCINTDEFIILDNYTIIYCIISFFTLFNFTIFCCVLYDLILY